MDRNKKKAPMRENSPRYHHQPNDQDEENFISFLQVNDISDFAEEGGHHINNNNHNSSHSTSNQVLIQNSKMEDFFKDLSKAFYQKNKEKSEIIKSEASRLKSIIQNSQNISQQQQSQKKANFGLKSEYRLNNLSTHSLAQNSVFDVKMRRINSPTSLHKAQNLISSIVGDAQYEKLYGKIINKEPDLAQSYVKQPLNFRNYNIKTNQLSSSMNRFTRSKMDLSSNNASRYEPSVGSRKSSLSPNSLLIRSPNAKIVKEGRAPTKCFYQSEQQVMKSKLDNMEGLLRKFQDKSFTNKRESESFVKQIRNTLSKEKKEPLPYIVQTEPDLDTSQTSIVGQALIVNSHNNINNPLNIIHNNNALNDSKDSILSRKASTHKLNGGVEPGLKVKPRFQFCNIKRKLIIKNNN